MQDPDAFAESAGDAAASNSFASTIATTSVRRTGDKPQHRVFIAVRSSCSLHAPAIFFSWLDAQKFVVQSEIGVNDSCYRGFPTLEEAVNYLESDDCHDASRVDPYWNDGGLIASTANVPLGLEADNTIALGREEWNRPRQTATAMVASRSTTQPMGSVTYQASATAQIPVQGTSYVLTQPASPSAIQTVAETNNSKKKVRNNNSDLSRNKLSKALLCCGGSSTAFQQGIVELDANWDHLLRLLWDFRREYGHGDIPGRCTTTSTSNNNNGPDPNNENGGGGELSRFVTMIRRYHKEWQEGKQENSRGGRKIHRQRQRLLSSFFTDDRIRQLDAMGFVWVTKRGVKPVHMTPEQEEESFTTKLSELRKIVLELKDPIRRHPKMQEWITKQRTEYKAFQAGIPSTMTTDRIAALAKAGFAFEAIKKRTWDERAVEWLEYKSKNGGKDPRRYDESGLGKWVRSSKNQRWCCMCFCSV
jgi:hypothetical protein